MTLEKIIADLKKGKVASCYLLYGEEDYLIGDALEQIVNELVPESDRDFGLFLLDGDQADFDLLKDHLLSPSLLGGRKVVVVKNTTIFQSRENLVELIRKIRDHLAERPEKAAAYFLSFLKISGFAWEDMLGEGWQKITDEQWRKAVENDTGDDRHQWLPRVIEVCEHIGLTADGGSDSAERFNELLAQGLPAGNCLILTAEAVDKRKKIFKIIEKSGVVLHFAELKNEAVTKEKLKGEAQKLLGRYGKSLTAAAWMALGKKTGFQLRHSLNELLKLVSYSGERAVIEESDVEIVVGKTKEDSIFDLTTALAEKNAPAALTALRALMDQGTHHLMILTMVGREIRLLLQASILLRSGKIAKINNNMDYGWFQKNIHPALAGLAPLGAKKEDLLVNKHPFVIYNALRHCGRFSYPDLVRFLDDLVDIDRAMKSSSADPQLLLERFLINTCAKAS